MKGKNDLVSLGKKDFLLIVLMRTCNETIYGGKFYGYSKRKIAEVETKLGLKITKRTKLDCTCTMLSSTRGAFKL